MTTPAPATAPTPATYRTLNPKQIAFSLTNRKRFDAAAMKDFVANVKAHGVITPVLVRPLPLTRTDCNGALFELVYGERRIRAAIEAGLTDVPANVRDLSDAQALEFQIVENVQREDIHPLEEAEAYERLMRCDNPDTKKKYTADDIAGKVGKSRRVVYSRLELLKLCPEVRAALFADKIDHSKGQLFARIGHHDTQRTALKELLAQDPDGDGISYRELQKHFLEEYTLDLPRAPFDIKVAAYTDAKKVIIAGPCGPCPKRSGNDRERFADIKSADVCTDIKCFNAKRDAAGALRRAEYEAGGKTVITGKAAKEIFPYRHNSPTGGFGDLDQTHYDNYGSPAYGQKYKTMLKKETPIVMVEHPETKLLIEVIDREAAKKLLKKNGFLTPSAPVTNNNPRSNPAEQKRMQVIALQQATRIATALALREKFKDGLTDVALRYVVTKSLEDEMDYNGVTAYLGDLYAPGIDIENAPDQAIAAIEKAIATAPAKDLPRLLFDIHMSRETAYSGHDDTFAALAKNHGIDAKAMEKQGVARLKEATEADEKRKADAAAAKKAAATAAKEKAKSPAKKAPKPDKKVAPTKLVTPIIRPLIRPM